MIDSDGRPASFVERVAEWARRRPVRLSLVALAVGCDALLLGGLGSHGGDLPLDLRLAYSPAAARAFLAAATPAARADMIRFGWIDLVFLGAYGLLLLGLARDLLLRLRRAGAGARGGWLGPYGLALLPSVFDLIESATILAVNLRLSAGRPAPEVAYGLMAAATPLKWLAFAALAGWLLAAWWRGRR